MIRSTDVAAWPLADVARMRAVLEAARSRAIAADADAYLSVVTAVEPIDELEFLRAAKPALPYFSLANPDRGEATAGFGTAVLLTAEGPARFAAIKAAIAAAYERLDVVGPPEFAPRFFCRFTFFDDAESARPFTAATAYLPEFELMRHGGRYALVASFAVNASSDVDALAARLAARADALRLRLGASRRTPPAAQHLEIASVASYRGDVRRAVAAIDSGAFEKVVLALGREVRREAAFDTIATVANLRAAFGSCTVFVTENSRGACFLGASPELLVRVDDQHVASDALAGSIERGATASEDEARGRDLLASEKDVREHRIVVEAIARRYRDLGMEALVESAPSIRKLENIQHLHTAIAAARPPSFHVLDAVAALHPTPAVGSAPQNLAREAIRRFETFARGPYAAPLGWVDAAGNGEFTVAIRSALVEGPRARLFAGCGIVAGSDPDRELDEVERKFDAILGALA